MKDALRNYRFIGIMYIGVQLYYTKYLGVEDEESLGTSRAEAGQEGFMSSFAVFMVDINIYKCNLISLHGYFATTYCTSKEALNK